MKLVIVDYGSGNLRSVENAMRAATTFAQLPHEIVISSDPVEVGKADYLVLPGVGAFADCRAGLDAIDGMIDAINHLAWDRRRPFLGICVGMQLMAEAGEEGGQTTPGLGWITGQITALDPWQDNIRLKVPHMGWNQWIANSSNPAAALFSGLSNDSRAYFLHGYHLTGGTEDQLLATTDYGEHIVAAVARDNMIGLQFHPEKSQHVGQVILANWLRLMS